jgi:urocanate hydratase
MGVVRHVDAGYDAAIGFGRNNGVRTPMDEV